ncbi:hypothetical protein LXL04_012165 [Taraxacum kok-saghyz]
MFDKVIGERSPLWFAHEEQTHRSLGNPPTTGVLRERKQDHGRGYRRHTKSGLWRGRGASNDGWKYHSVWRQLLVGVWPEAAKEPRRKIHGRKSSGRNPRRKLPLVAGNRQRTAIDEM